MSTAALFIGTRNTGEMNTNRLFFLYQRLSQICQVAGPKPFRFYSHRKLILDELAARILEDKYVVLCEANAGLLLKSIRK